jgi:hypothetical protein
MNSRAIFEAKVPFHSSHTLRELAANSDLLSPCLHEILLLDRAYLGGLQVPTFLPNLLFLDPYYFGPMNKLMCVALLGAWCSPVSVNFHICSSFCMAVLPAQNSRTVGRIEQVCTSVLILVA